MESKKHIHPAYPASHLIYPGVGKSHFMHRLSLFSEEFREEIESFLKENI